MTEFKTIGKDIPQIDSWAKVTGKAEFVTDVQRAHTLYGKILYSDRAHAKILSIDTSEAEKYPGVKAVITYKDTPGIWYGPTIDDWQILAKDEVRFIGEEVAAVAATTEEIAEKAVSLIKVTYEDLPAVFDPEEALLPDAPLVNGWLQKDNIASRFEMHRGDVEADFAASDLVFEATYTLARVYQGYMEPNGCSAEASYPEGGTMWAPSQYTYAQRDHYAKALDVPASKLRLIKQYVGGAFGAKYERDCHPIALLLAKKTGRPVKITLTREEDFMTSNARVPMKISVKMGVKKDGTFLAKQVRIVSNNGARTVFAPAVTSTTCYRVDNLYRFHSVKADGYIMYTNMAPTGAMRGFGNAQMTYALESSIDAIAEKLNLDPAEIRLKNAVETGDVTIHGWKIQSCGLRECIDDVLKQSDFRNKRLHPAPANGSKVRGVGFACANHVSGNRGFFGPFDGAGAYVRVFEDGRICVTHGESDLGQGQNTVAAQIAAEVLQQNVSKVDVSVSDSDHIPFGLGSFASRGTIMMGNAVLAAAQDAKKKVLETASEEMGIPVDGLHLEDGFVVSSSDSSKRLPLGRTVEIYVHKNIGLHLEGIGNYKPDTAFDPVTKYGNISPGYLFGAQVAEVEVDTDTGEVEILHFYASQDVGQIINSLTLKGQLIGGLAMGFGWALSEEMLSKDGRFTNPGFLDYRMLGPRDMPPITFSIVESHEPNGPFGAKGASELMLNPVPSAIANAVYNAIGVRIRDLPITPEKILRALGKI